MKIQFYTNTYEDNGTFVLFHEIRMMEEFMLRLSTFLYSSVNRNQKFDKIKV